MPPSTTQPATENSPAAEPATAWRWVHAALLMLVFGVALFVRVYGLDQETLWWDEVSNVLHLPAPAAYLDSPYYEEWNGVVMREEPRNVFHYLRNNRSLDPASMPLYYSLQYFFANLFGSEMIKLRLLSVAMGMLQVVLLYLFGRAVFGPTAGLVAAACLALSPTHTYYSQEVRMYVAFSLLALLSSITLWWAWERGGRRRWLLHALAQGCLTLTHPFALLVPFTQGVFLVICYARQWQRIARWVALTLAAFVPTALVLLNTSYWGADEVGWLSMPTLQTLYSTLFGSDAIAYGATAWGNPAFWEWMTERGSSYDANWARGQQFFQGRALMVISGGLAAIALLGMGIRGLRRRGEHTPVLQAKWGVYFLLWWTLPATTLFVASHLWRPCMAARYTQHSSMALYLLMGAGVAMLPGRTLKAVAAAVLITVSAYQQSMVLGPPKRTDYQSAADHIIEHAHPRDVILVHNGLWMRVFAYILGPVPNVVSYGGFNHLFNFSPDMFSELTELAAFAAEHGRATKPPGEAGIVWLVAETQYGGNRTSPVLDEKLTRRGLEFDWLHYKGKANVFLYRVELPADSPPPQYFPEELGPNAVHEFLSLTKEYFRWERYEEALAGLTALERMGVEMEHNLDMHADIQAGMGNLDEAIALYFQAAQRSSWEDTNLLFRFARTLHRADANAAAVNMLEGILPRIPEGSREWHDAHALLSESRDALSQQNGTGVPVRSH